jgi:hypothetical protein
MDNGCSTYLWQGIPRLQPGRSAKCLPRERGEISAGPQRKGKSEPKEQLARLPSHVASLTRSPRTISVRSGDGSLFILRPRRFDNAKEFRKAFQVVAANGFVWFRCCGVHFCRRKSCLPQKGGILDMRSLVPGFHCRGWVRDECLFALFGSCKDFSQSWPKTSCLNREM